MDRLVNLCINQSIKKMREAQRNYIGMWRARGHQWEYYKLMYDNALVSSLGWKERAERLRDVPFLSSASPVVFSPENFDVIVGIAGRLFDSIFFSYPDPCAFANISLGEDAEKIITKKVRAIERELVNMGLLDRNARVIEWHYDCKNELLSLSLVCRQ